MVAPSGSLSLRVYRTPAQGLRGFVSGALPRRGLPAAVNAWRLKNLPRVSVQFVKVMVAVSVARWFGVTTVYGRLSLRATLNGVVHDLGVASYRVVTDSGVAFIVDAMHASATIANLKFHGFGTGTTAEASSQTALVTELTTQYATDNTRPTGSQGEGASANIYSTAATLTPDADCAITEHSVFDQAANSGGTMLDRSKFTSVGLVAATSDSLAATYQFTITSGS